MSRRDGLAECRGCGMPVRFVILTSGKRMPVNPASLPAGTARPGDIAAQWIGYHLHGRVIGLGDEPGRALLFRTHFATCTQRQAARRPKPEPPAPPAPATLF